MNGLETVLSNLQIVIIGPSGSPRLQELVQAVHGRSLPAKLLMVVDPDSPLPEGHPAHGKTMENGQPTAYVCQQQACSLPVTNPVALSQMLQLPVNQAQVQQAQGMAGNANTPGGGVN